MSWINYHHLLYFWTVAREGSIAAAAESLHLSPPTISSQIRTLERALGHKLFAQVGRNLQLTKQGEIALRYANDIFSLGQEMLVSMNEHREGERALLRIGVADVLPKLIVSRLIKPALDLSEQCKVVCFEGKAEELLGRLAIHQLELVIADVPLGGDLSIRAFNHQLGDCGVSLLAESGLARELRADFPRSLDAAPFLLPTSNSSLRRLLDYWFASNDIAPFVLAEFEDSGLLKACGWTSRGVFPAPSVIEEEIHTLYGVDAVGRLEGIRQPFYAISPERKVRNRGVLAIIEAARQDLFH